MDINYYKKYEPLFNAWYIKEMIGEGSFGQVYEIERKEMGVTYKAAMKTITIPQSKSELKSILAEGMSNADVTAYYKGIVQDIINEFILMTKLKGTSNVVSYEDHMLIKHEGSIGWDILIRMELLTPLYDHMAGNNMSKKEVIKMGIDLCRALELCQKYNIIHRDVKPENIFISNNGDYKLGDFGIAKTVEKTSSGLSRKGTYTYMAPEIYKGGAYGVTVDIYSLGIVMYRLLNDNRTPFLPAYPAPITHSDKENALMKRIGGTPLPSPVNADGKLAEVILKACSYESKNRFSSAAEMRAALEAILHRQSEEALSYAEHKAGLIKSIEYVSMKKETSVAEAKTEAAFRKDTVTGELTELEKTESAFGNTQNLELKKKAGPQKQKKKTGVLVAAAAAVLVVAAVIIFVFTPKEVEDITGIEVENKLYIGESMAPDYVIMPEKFADEKISFTVKDEGIIQVDKNGKITGVGAGSTTLTMSAKGYEESVVVIVSPKVTEISNVKDKIEMEEGDSTTLKPVLAPEEFADEPISYGMDDEEIASINENGKLKALKPGKTSLTISAGGCTKTIQIVVTEYVEPEPTYQQPQYTPTQSKPKATQATPKSTQAPTEADSDGYWE